MPYTTSPCEQALSAARPCAHPAQLRRRPNSPALTRLASGSCAQHVRLASTPQPLTQHVCLLHPMRDANQLC